MNRLTMLAAAAAALSLGGCSTTLQIHDQKVLPSGEFRTLPGVPFRTMEFYRREGELTRQSEGKACTRAPFAEVVAIPNGPIHYANVSVGPLSKGEFSMTMAENGALTAISTKSEPVVTPIDSIVGAATSLFSAFGAAPAAASVEATTEGARPQDTGPLCDAGPVVSRFERIAPPSP